MDNSQVGKLIRSLRTEKKMTQRQLAKALCITEQAVSKWERGLGGPDIILLPALSAIFGVNIENILAGDLQANSDDRGNLKKLKFFVCPSCGGIVTSTGQAEASCCGRKLASLALQPADEAHYLRIEPVEDEYYVTCNHPMSRSHYISFIACVATDRLLLIRLYPQQEAAVRIPQIKDTALYCYCTQHGLRRAL